MKNSPPSDQNTLYRIRYIHGQMSSPTSLMSSTTSCVPPAFCRPPHPTNFVIDDADWMGIIFHNTTLIAIHMHLISQFACKRSTFQSVKGPNRRIKSRSGDGSRHLGCSGRSSSTSVGPRWPAAGTEHGTGQLRDESLKIKCPASETQAI